MIGFTVVVKEAKKQLNNEYKRALFITKWCCTPKVRVINLTFGVMSYEALLKKMEKYIDYYNNDRIKQILAGMSPIKYRTHASQLAA